MSGYGRGAAEGDGHPATGLMLVLSESEEACFKRERIESAVGTWRGQQRAMRQRQTHGADAAMDRALFLLTILLRRRSAIVTDALGRADHVPRGQRAAGARLRDWHGESAEDVE